MSRKRFRLSVEDIEKEAQAAEPGEPLEEIEPDLDDIGDESDEVEGYVDDAEDAIDDTEGLEEINDVLTDAEESEGLSEPAAELTEIASEAFAERLGIRMNTRLTPSLEAFHSTSPLERRKTATRIAREENESRWAQAKATVVKFFEMIKEKLMGLIGRIFDMTPRLRKTAEDLKKKAESLRGQEPEETVMDAGEAGKAFAPKAKLTPDMVLQGLKNIAANALEVPQAALDFYKASTDEVSKEASSVSTESLDDTMKSQEQKPLFRDRITGLFGRTIKLVWNPEDKTVSAETEESPSEGENSSETEVGPIDKLIHICEEAIKTLAVGERLKNLKNATGSLFDRATSALQKFYENPKEGLANLYKSITQSITNAFTRVINFVTSDIPQGARLASSYVQKSLAAYKRGGKNETGGEDHANMTSAMKDHAKDAMKGKVQFKK